MERLKEILALVIILILVGASLTAIYFLQSGLEVEVFNPSQRTVIRNLKASGFTRLQDNNDVISPHTGQVARVFVSEGSQVETGDILWEFRSEEWEEELKQKEFQLRSMVFEIESMQKQQEERLQNLIREKEKAEESLVDLQLTQEEEKLSIRAEKEAYEENISNLKRELTQKKRDLKELEELWEEDMLSLREMEIAREEVNILEERLKREEKNREVFLEKELPLREKRMERRYEEIKKNIQHLTQEIEKAEEEDNRIQLLKEEKTQIQGEIARLEKAIENHQIKAEYPGFIKNLQIETGQRLTRGNKVAEIGDPEQMEIVLQIPSRDFHRLETGLDVQIELEDVHPPIEGEISWISPWAQEEAVEVGVNRTDRRDLLKPGMEFEATVNLRGRRVLVVPPHVVYERELPDTRPIIREGEETAHYVFLVDEDAQKVYPHQVRVGQRTEEYVEIISGLSSTSDVVIGDAEALEELRARLAEWERREISEIRVNFTGER